MEKIAIVLFCKNVRKNMFFWQCTAAFLDFERFFEFFSKIVYFFSPQLRLPFRGPSYHLMETIRPLIEVHWGV